MTLSVIEDSLFNQLSAFNNKTQNNKSALLPMPQKTHAEMTDKSYRTNSIVPEYTSLGTLYPNDE